jgi:predicted TIM-barrel fold metal-dependent hydrolase
MAYDRISREWDELGYSDEVKEGLFHKNAERVLGFVQEPQSESRRVAR